MILIRTVVLEAGSGVGNVKKLDWSGLRKHCKEWDVKSGHWRYTMNFCISREKWLFPLFPTIYLNLLIICPIYFSPLNYYIYLRDFILEILEFVKLLANRQQLFCILSHLVQETKRLSIFVCFNIENGVVVSFVILPFKTTKLYIFCTVWLVLLCFSLLKMGFLPKLLQTKPGF